MGEEATVCCKMVSGSSAVVVCYYYALSFFLSLSLSLSLFFCLCYSPFFLLLFPFLFGKVRQRLVIFYSPFLLAAVVVLCVETRILVSLRRRIPNLQL